MSRISKVFREKKALIGYLTAGDAQEEDFLSLLESGVNILEIGVPFSDPIADGPVIQRAMERSLRKGTTVDHVLQLAQNLRALTETPLILFSYLNPIQKDLRGFLLRAKNAGVDGILIVDLPVEESAEYCKLCEELGLDSIFVLAPSTPLHRVQEIASKGRGFLYYACRKGTTGARAHLPEDLGEKIASFKAYTTLPIAVGFGISSQKGVEEVFKLADGAVVGSHFVEGKKL